MNKYVDGVKVHVGGVRDARVSRNKMSNLKKSKLSPPGGLQTPVAIRPTHGGLLVMSSCVSLTALRRVWGHPHPPVPVHPA